MGAWSSAGLVVLPFLGGEGEACLDRLEGLRLLLLLRLRRRSLVERHLLDLSSEGELPRRLEELEDSFVALGESICFKR